MNVSRTIIRRSSAYLSGRAMASPIAMLRQQRNLATAAASATASAATSLHDTLVKEAMKKMISNRDNLNDEEVSKPIADEDLVRRFRHYQNVYKEAELCISDLREAGDNFDDELQCANGAVDTTFTAYVDLLEDLRRANEAQLEVYKGERLEHANNLKKLRRELDVIVQNA